MFKININDKDEIKYLISTGKDKKFYYESYLDFINERKSTRLLDKTKLDFYSETHHIIPKCRGGDDNENNLVLLSMREHIIAHILLAEAFPEYPELSVAARFMIGRGYNSDKDIIQLIKTEEESVIKSLIEVSNKKYEIPVVCFNDKYTVIRVYNSLTEASKDGFSIPHISSAISGSRKSTGGYTWSKLDDFSKTNYKELEKYYSDIDAGIIQTIERPDNRIICCKNDLTVVRIFKNIKEVEQYGLDSRQISAVLVGKQKSSRGLLWFRYKDFLEKFGEEKLNNFDPSIDLKDYIEYNEPQELPDKIIVMFDDSTNIIKGIYTKDGIRLMRFKYAQVMRVAFKKERKHYGGFSWYLYDEFRQTHKNLLDEYEKPA